MLTQEQGGRLFRLVWIMAVRAAIEEPKATWVAPWEKMREWERIVAKRVYTEVHETIVSHPEYYLAYQRSDGGRLVREQWIKVVRLHVPNPRPSHLAPWEEMQEWEQEADCTLFEYIRATVLPYQLASLSPDHAVGMASQSVKNVSRMALAGPYIGDDQTRDAQKGAALRIAELFVAPIVVSLDVLIEARKEHGPVDAKYQLAYEEARGFLSQIRAEGDSLLSEDTTEGLLSHQRRVSGTSAGWGFVAYRSDGEIVYKDENYDPHPGDSLDLLVETWQPYPFEQKSSDREVK